MIVCNVVFASSDLGVFQPFDGIIVCQVVSMVGLGILRGCRGKCHVAGKFADAPDESRSDLGPVLPLVKPPHDIPHQIAQPHVALVLIEMLVPMHRDGRHRQRDRQLVELKTAVAIENLRETPRQRRE